MELKYQLVPAVNKKKKTKKKLILGRGVWGKETPSKCVAHNSTFLFLFV
jgi:hypothetical protein